MRTAYDGTLATRKILKEEAGGDAINRLRIVLTKMKEGKGWDAYLSETDKTKKISAQAQQRKCAAGWMEAWR